MREKKIYICAIEMKERRMNKEREIITKLLFIRYTYYFALLFFFQFLVIYVILCIVSFFFKKQNKF
jgi:hypothetical protein